MAPSSEHDRRANENVDPQQRPYQSLTRRGGKGARPSAVVAAKLAVAARPPALGDGGEPRPPTGIERSYASLSGALPSAAPSPRGLASPASLASRQSSAAGSYSSFTRYGRGGGGANAHRTSTGTVRAAARGSSGRPSGSSGGASKGSSSSSAHAKGAKATGIERSYDSVAQTIRSVATFASSSSSPSRKKNGGSPRSGDGLEVDSSNSVGGIGDSGRDSGRGQGHGYVRGSSSHIHGSSSHSRCSDDSGRVGPPPPAASASFASSASTRHGDSATPSTVVHSSPPRVGTSATFSFDNASTQASRTSHVASASISVDEFQRLKLESRRLKAKHQARYGASGGVPTAASREWTVASSTVSAMPRGVPETSGSGNKAEGGQGGNLGHSTSTTVISNKSRRTSSSHSHGRTKKGIVKMTTNRLSKIRDMLNMNSQDSGEVMSFYCSDGQTGKVEKQRVSLEDRSKERGGDVKEMLETAGYSRAGRRALPQSPMSRVKKVAESACESVDTVTATVKQGLGPKIEAATKTAAKVAHEGVDAMTIKEMAPKIGTGIATTAKKTAKGVVKVTQQSVEGVGLMAKDLANAKTPARSNVTRNKGGTHAEYVDDPDYKVVLSPVDDNGSVGKEVARGTEWSNLKTPACLVGAITAGRCDLPDTHPGSLEFLPEGIPRVLVVPEDWEERAGFVAAGPVAATCVETNTTGIDGASTGVVRAPGNVTDHDIENMPKEEGDRRASNPIDIDEETETINGEEIDHEEMLALREGKPSPKNGCGQITPSVFEEANENGLENDDEKNMEQNVDGTEECNDPRNASMWAIAPEGIDEDDGDLLDNSMHVENINMGALLDEHNESSFHGDEVPENANKNESITPTSSAGTGTVGTETFFVGDVQFGFESPSNNDKNTNEDARQLMLEEDAKRWTPNSKVTDTIEKDDHVSQSMLEEDAKRWTPDSKVPDATEKEQRDASQLMLEEDAKRWSPGSKGTDATAKESHDASRSMLEEDAKRWTPDSKAVDPIEKGEKNIGDVADACDEGRSREPNGRDSLLSLAESTTAAMMDHKKKDFETPFSVKKGERQLSFSEFKTMNKQVLFDLDNGKDEEACAKELYSMNPVNVQLQLTPSESTKLSHEPSVRMKTDAGHQKLHASETQFSRDGTGIAKEEPSIENDQNNNYPSAPVEGAKSGKRALKGRLVLVRIKKKFSKVAKKVLTFPFKGIKQARDCSDQLSIMNGSASYVVSLPKVDKLPTSPSSMSASSVASSIMSGNVKSVASSIMSGNINRIIGALPPKNESPHHQLLYGAISYGMRSMEGSTEDELDALPAPPGELLPHSTAGSCDEDYLAEAMKRSKEDDTESVLLLVTPKDDGAPLEAVSGLNGTPVQTRDIIDAEGVTNWRVNSDVTNSSVRPENLAALFTNEKGDTVSDGALPVQIMDAVEVDGGIVLTPQNINLSGVFRPSTDRSGVNLLPSSTIETDDDEDDTLLLHDGQTIVHSSTFGDNTVATHQTSTYITNPDNGAEPHPKHTPKLSPDGLPLSRMAAENGSFLFSPDNMGRAKPSVRAKSRAKDAKTKPSITMLPAVNTQTKKSESSALVVKRCYSHELTSSTRSSDVQPGLQSRNSCTSAYVAPEDHSRFSLSNNSLPMAKEVEEQSEEFTETNQHCQSSCNTLINDGESEALSPEASIASQEEDQTPLVSNTAPVKKKYLVTPFPEKEGKVETPNDVSSSPLFMALSSPSSSLPVEAETADKTVDEVNSSPLLVALNSPLSSSPSTFSSKSVKDTSPSSGSISSFKSTKGNKKKITKSVPKSALKTRKGFVKDRVSHIQQRIEEVSSNGAVNGRLKRNHSYRYKNLRRATNGNGALAPKKAILQTTYIRSVPICIAKTRSSLGSSFEQDDIYTVSGYSHETNFSAKEAEPEADTEERVSYAAKYKVNTNATKPAGPVNRGHGSISDASSFVSENTDSDPFNSLLGKMTSDDEQSSSSDEEDSHVGKQAAAGQHDPNGDADDSHISPSAHLPFKPSTLVTLTELNQHIHYEKHKQCRPAVSPLSAHAPSKPNMWRTLAAAAAKGEKESSGKDITNSNAGSARFRSEKSMMDIFNN